MNFNQVSEFEFAIANWFGAPYGVAVDSCTHGIELCMRKQGIKEFSVPKRTYLSVPMLANKMGIKFTFRDERWEDFYQIGETNIYDAAVLWRENSYIPDTFMCLSFQYQKHLSLGRGGMILCDNEYDACELKKMSYDGRDPNIPWREQNIDTMGYHYYMTPETAQLGLNKLEEAMKTPPKKWKVTDWPDLSLMEVFNG